ncbi:hypothetical protein [Chryseobacterium fistulae]|uniref:Uncharacterized protein n=1 Tax=Chryseobacterium fistulae TaxID=2675058 RepID=A0A6N4XUZ7_9FLAO|nr:hypothetical protein [Chryseobacterium fistulae]CAA7387090.1 hypothetical protein CHRY9393_01392 [Chryseobacterium fistulae]
MNAITQTLLNIKEFAEGEKPLDYILIAVNEAKAEFQNRIFNSEEGAKDDKAKGLGKYTNAYARYRIAKGRQAKVIDLELTGSLRRDIKVIKNQSQVLIIIISDVELEKLEHLERMYTTKIFSLNKQEYERYAEKAAELFIGELIHIFNNE